jgi:hypothetical protein
MYSLSNYFIKKEEWNGYKEDIIITITITDNKVIYQTSDTDRSLFKLIQTNEIHFSIPSEGISHTYDFWTLLQTL